MCACGLVCRGLYRRSAGWRICSVCGRDCTAGVPTDVPAKCVQGVRCPIISTNSIAFANIHHLSIALFALRQCLDFAPRGLSSLFA